MYAGCASHIFIDHIVNATRHVDHRQTGTVGEWLHSAFGRITINLHATASEIVGIEEAKQEICVGHRRGGAATIVADGARFRAGTLGSDFQKLHIVYMRDATATGTDFDQLDSRDVERKAAPFGKPFLARRLEMIVDMRFAFVH